MSNYFDNKELFMTPQVNQYGNHMVMTNVSKETKTKYINFDTKYSDDLFTEHSFNNGQNTQNTSGNYGNFNFTLPDRITGVKSIYVENVDFPILNYNVLADIGNNYFQVIKNGISTIIKVPDGNYNQITLIDKLQTLLSINTVDISVSINNVDITNDNKYINLKGVDGSTYIVNFAVDEFGNFDKYNFKSKLGWLLGFRNQSYTFNGGKDGIYATSKISFSYSKYYYLAIDEFSTNFQNSFMSALPFSQINKYIICKINVNVVNSYMINNSILTDSSSDIQYNYHIPSNHFNGYLVSGMRTYNGKIDLQKLNVKIIDDSGKIVNLQGQDVSFCLKIEYE